MNCGDRKQSVAKKNKNQKIERNKELKHFSEYDDDDAPNNNLALHAFALMRIQVVS